MINSNDNLTNSEYMATPDATNSFLRLLESVNPSNQALTYEQHNDK